MNIDNTSCSRRFSDKCIQGKKEDISLLRYILEDISPAVIIHDLECIIDFSPVLLDILKLKKIQKGYKLAKLFFDDEFNTFIEQCKNIKRKNQIAGTIVDLRISGKHLQTLIISSKMWKQYKGSFFSILIPLYSSNFGISSKKISLIDGIFNLIDSIFLIAEENGRIIYKNTFSSAFWRSEKELSVIDKVVDLFEDGKDLKMLIDSLSAFKEGSLKKVESGCVVGRNKNGFTRHFVWKMGPFYLQKEKLRYQFFYALDITPIIGEKNRLEDRLNAIWNIILNAPIGIYRTTPAGRVLMANNTMAEMLGYSSVEELKSINVTEGYHPDTPRVLFLQAFTDKDIVKGLEFKWFRKDKSVIWVRENSRAYRDREGNILYFEGTIEDITNQKRYEEQLVYHVQLERTVAKISKLCASYDLSTHCTGISDALGALAQFLNAEHGGYFKLNRDRNIAFLVYEWPYQSKQYFYLGSDYDKIFDVHQYPWFARKLWRNEIIIVPSINNLPKEAKEERSFIERNGIKSLVIIPSVIESKIVGFASFETFSHAKYWNEEDLKVLNSAIDIIGGTVERSILNEDLKRRIEIHSLISDLSISLSDITEEKLPETVIKALEEIGVRLSIDSILFYRFESEGCRYIREYSWGNNFNLDVFNKEDMPWFLNILMKGKTVIFSSINDLPKEALKEQQILINSGVKSLAIFPCIEMDNVYGCMWFLNKRDYINFDEILVGSLQVVTLIVARFIQRVKAEARLRFERLLMNYLMSNIPDSIYFKDRESRFLRVSNGLVRKFGCKSEEEVLNKTDFDFFADEHAREAFEDEQQILKTGNGIFNKIEKETWPDGSVTWVSTTKLPLKIGDEIIGTFGMSRDLTELKELQDTIARERDLLKVIIDNIHGVSISLRDSEGHFILANEEYSKILNVPVDNIIGKTEFDLFEEEIARRHFEDDKEIINNGVSKFNQEETIKVDDRIYNMLTSRIPIKGHDGKVTSILVVSSDITSLKKAEEKRLEIMKRLEMSKRLESFGLISGRMAHDFNNMLTGIMGCVSLVSQMLEGDSKVWPYIKQIETIVMRARELTEHLLTYAGKREVPKKLFDIKVVLKETVDMIKLTLPDTIIWECSIQEDMPLVYGNDVEIRQVLMNIIKNAGEAIENLPGTIAVKACLQYCTEKELRCGYGGESLSEGNYVVISVRDTGKGMDSETLSRIFEPFFTTKKKGKGLGLSEAIGIIKNHHGTIVVTSEINKGTEFKIYLPISEQEIEGKAEEVSSAKLEVWMIGNAVVADDDNIVRLVTSKILESAGFKVKDVDSIESLLEVIKSTKDIKVVIIDVSMEKAYLKDLLKEINKMLPSVKVILTSGYNESQATTGLDRGDYAGYVQKPFDASSLIATIRRAFLQP